MCIVIVAYRVHPDFPLMVAANRDEFHGRPTQSAHFWEDQPNLLAGRDEEAGGTWLGISRSGRLAAITNYSETLDPAHAATLRSRGLLTERFLSGTDDAWHYAQAVAAEDQQYRGFNLLTFDGQALTYHSNRGRGPEQLTPGVYAVANDLLDTEWPKVTRGKAAIAQRVAAATTIEALRDELLAMLADEGIPPDEELPNRGNTVDFERRVAPCFIRGDEYGTRASTVVCMAPDQIWFTEATFAADGIAGDVATFELALGH